MPSAVTAVLNLSNWLAFLLGTVANILVVYLCFKVRNTEIKTLRRCLASVAVFELVECVDLSAMQAGIQKLNGIPSITLKGIVDCFPIVVAKCFYVIFFAMIILRLLSLPMSFLYRFAMICG
uniref:G_PROTEIN_RECEP_F1_2 domain-containing protein n=1 Tax=Ascaris lumbricoides TaxID=6252 RepID=A0A0M3IJG5_ASCLU